MQYEIDFIGVDTVSNNADAIAMRWKENFATPYIVGIYDGGYKDHGEALCEHIWQYYKTDSVNFVVCSHPDADHASGLEVVLNNLHVKCLYMNIPWGFINDIWNKVNDGRITKNSLENRLKEKYPYITTLEELAVEKGIPISSCFQGMWLANKWAVLSPSKEFYLHQLVNSSKTPLAESEGFLEGCLKLMADERLRYIIIDQWSEDSLLMNPETTPENEMSCILYGMLEPDKMLLTGDAGVQALSSAYEYALIKGIDLSQEISFYQIPHHGSRHNLSTDVMDKIVGPIISKNHTTARIAYVSTAKTMTIQENL